MSLRHIDTYETPIEALQPDAVAASPINTTCKPQSNHHMWNLSLLNSRKISKSPPLGLIKNMLTLMPTNKTTRTNTHHLVLIMHAYEKKHHEPVDINGNTTMPTYTSNYCKQ